MQKRSEKYLEKANILLEQVKEQVRCAADVAEIRINKIDLLKLEGDIANLQGRTANIAERLSYYA